MQRATLFLLLVMCASLCCLVGLGADANHEGPKAPAAQAAKAQYIKKLEQIQADARQKMEAARRDYLSELEKLKDNATRQADLDEAIRIRDAIKSVKEEDFPPTSAPRLSELQVRQALCARLASTTWSLKDGIRTRLNPDGTLTQLGSDVTGSWAALDGNSIVLFTSHRWADVWTFDKALKSLRAVHGGMGDPFDGHKVD